MKNFQMKEIWKILLFAYFIQALLSPIKNEIKTNDFDAVSFHTAWIQFALAFLILRNKFFGNLLAAFSFFLHRI